MACAKELDLDLNKLNVDGGAIAVGHPLAASGSRITAHLVHELRYVFRNIKKQSILLSVPIYLSVSAVFFIGDEILENWVSAQLVSAVVKALP